MICDRQPESTQRCGARGRFSSAERSWTGRRSATICAHQLHVRGTLPSFIASSSRKPDKGPPYGSRYSCIRPAMGHNAPDKPERSEGSGDSCGEGRGHISCKPRYNFGRLRCTFWRSCNFPEPAPLMQKQERQAPKEEEPNMASACSALSR